MSICPSCRKPVDARLTRCPWDGTLLGAITLDPLLGTALGGRYLLRKCIGERDRIRLYTAEEKTTGRAVLATLISTSRGSDAGAAERFRNRVELGRSLDHPSCTVVRDYGLLGDGRAYVIEEGEVWHQLSQELVLKGGRLPLSKALDLAIQLVEGLDHLHGKGLYNTHVLSSSLRLIFDAQGALKLQIPTAEVIGHLLQNEQADHAEPSEGLAEDLQGAARVLMEMLLGDGYPGKIEWTNFGLDEEVRKKLQTIVDRALGQLDEKFGSAWEMRRELESLTGRSRLGRYTLLHRIAVGGMGEIYLARAEGIEGLDLTRLCVIKTIRTSLVQSAEFVERFLAEARVLASLSHGNIVPVHDVGKVGSVFYIAMEYVAGKDLRKILSRAAKEKRRMSVPLALFVAKELANGLAYAHRAKVQGMGGLVHRDVSPHNTLVSYEGEVKLIDFGLARAGAELNRAKDEVVMGKVCYISPEQARAEALDQRTDIYSAGLVLFELLTGEPFFNQPTIEEVLEHVGSPTPEPPSARAPGIPAEVDRICLRAMAPRCEDRYRSAGALRDDLTAELARLAPRTNPEEVGQFVRKLFSVEQRDEEMLLSDLSMAISPVSISSNSGPSVPGAARTDPPLPARTSSEALSLLGRRPLPIQLTTLRDEGAQPTDVTAPQPLAMLAPTLPARSIAFQIPPSAATPVTPAPASVPWTATDTPVPFEGPVNASEIVISDNRTLGTDQLPALSTRPPWRSPVVLGFMVAFVGVAGVVGGFWISSSRTQASREAERAAFKALAGWGSSLGSERQAMRPPNAGTRPAVTGEDPEPPSSIKLRPPRPKVQSEPAAPSPCLIQFRGGSGLELIVDGAPVRGRLPLPRPLSVAAGEHRILVRGQGLEPYRQRLTCSPGEELTVKLRLRPR